MLNLRVTDRSRRQVIPAISNLACLFFALLGWQVMLPQLCRATEPADPYDALYDVIMTRKSKDGKTFGREHAAPLIWNSSGYLLDGKTHRRFIAALDTFGALSQKEIEAYSDLKRALLQRHLWAVFDWSTVRRPPTWDEPPELKAARFNIQRKVTGLMKRLALSEDQIRALPNPLKPVVEAGTYRESFNPDDAFDPFLPTDLFDESGPWVCLRQTRDGLPGKNHSESEEWRSAFLVFVRVPGDRKQTLAYLDKLNKFTEAEVNRERRSRLNSKTPHPPIGTQFAIVEQAMLISDRGEPTLSPLIQNIQVRAYLSYDFKDLEALMNRTQAFAEFVMEPRKLMQGKPALRAVGRDERHFTTFFTNEPFETRGRQITDLHLRLKSCMSCHMAKGIWSVNSQTRTFHHGSPRPVKLREGKVSSIAESTAARKKRDYTWGVLEVLWRNEENERPSNR
jgi:hypothetical protein